MERHELISEFSAALQGAERSIDGNTLAAGRVKTRLLEAHAPEPGGDGACWLLGQLSEPAGFKVQGIAEDMWLIAGPATSFVIDTLDPRFWLLHSTASAREVERFTTAHLVSDARIDRAWLPSSILSALPGARHLLSASFSADPLLSAAPGANARTRRLRVRVEADEPEDLLALLRESPRFATVAALGSIGARLAVSDVGNANVVADYLGRVVTSGTSFEVALQAMWALLDRYRALINLLERAYRLRLVPIETAGLRLEGDVATLSLPEPVADVQQFVEELFSSREPFRLWAVPHETYPGFWEADAVDLHVGQVIRLEITADWIRVLLREQTCGNTLARLVVNLQHHLNARVNLPETALAAVG